MNLKKSFREKELIIEIPLDMIMAEETISEKEMSSGLMPATNTPSRISDPAIRAGKTTRDPFFDENYQAEIDAAKNLVKEVDRQLSKEIPSPGDVKMPEDIPEGKTKEEISNKVYSGESNIEYNLGERFHRRLPIPVYLARGGGIVTVDISVNREGRVVASKPRKNSSIYDELIYYYAQVAADRTLFNADEAAPALQNGYIRYTFVSQ